MGVLKYPPSERKEHMVTVSVAGLDSGCEGMQEVLWVLYRPLGY